MGSVQNVTNIIRRNSKLFLIKLDSSDSVNLNFINKNNKSQLDQFDINNYELRKIKNKNDFSKHGIPIGIRTSNLDKKVRLTNLNMFKLELESEFNHIGDSCEFDLPEKFLCQKTTRKLYFTINCKSVKKKKVSFDYLKENYPLLLLNFIQQKSFQD